MNLLAIDPGEYYGAALFIDKVLHSTYFQALPTWPLDVCVVEDQDISRRTQNPRSIITLAHTAGRLAERAHAQETQWILPVRWKGTAPDHAIEARILGALAPEERKVLDRCLKTVPLSHRHDVTDAVGIGLHHLRRLPR